MSIFRGPQIFQESINQHKILGARMVTRSQFYTQYSQIFGTTEQNEVARMTWRAEYIPPPTKALRYNSSSNLSVK